jgi:hypothetical protein
MDYPHIPQHIGNEALFEHFNLTQDERYSLPRWRKDQNMLGYVVLLKSYAFLGFPPRKKDDVPHAVVSWISQQLDVDTAEYQCYQWKSRLWDIHLSAIRDHTGFRPGNKEDFQTLGRWLIEKANGHATMSKMYAAAIRRCRSLKIELPTEKELQRLVSSSWQQYLNQTCQTIAQRLEPSIREQMDQCLDIDLRDRERYNWMKGKPGKMGMKTLLQEIRRLRFVNGFDIQADKHLVDVPTDVLKLLREKPSRKTPTR